MPICTFSNDYDANKYTLVENRFIIDYLPIMDANDIRVYLYGLYLCHNVYSVSNNLDGICKGVNLKNSEVKKSFEVLQALGLVNITSTAPLSVIFNSPEKALPAHRTYNADKYSDFILNIQQLFVGKELSETDLHAFVDFLESSEMQPDALIMIAGYCIDLKGGNVSRNYVLTVARSWASEGCLTVSDVENRLLQAESVSEQIKQILHALRSKRQPDIDDREYVIKWGKLGFDIDAILVACKRIKRGGMSALDELLESFAGDGVFTAPDIKAYTEHREQIEACTTNILKNLGLRYQDITAVCELSIAPLFQKGFTSNGLQKISRYCYMNGTRDMAGFCRTVEDFYKGGYISDHSIDLQLDALTRFDDNVQNVIYATGSSRKITAADRDLYRTWSVVWGISDQTILQYARESQGKAYAMSWLGNRLSELKGNDVFVPEKAVKEPTEKKPSGMSDFEKAEIREKLFEDAIYSTLMARKKKLDFELSEYVFSDKAIPPTKQKEVDDLQHQIDARILELGYKTEDLK